MILCTVTTDWITAVVSTLAFGGTVYALWDTRKDTIKIQAQVDSLTKLALTYEKSHRNSIMPELRIRDIYFNSNNGFVEISNIGFIALDVQIISAKVGGVKIINITGALESTIPKDSSVRYNLNLSNQDPISEYYKGIPFTIRVSFKNKENEIYQQNLEVNYDNERISYPPQIEID